MIDLINAISEAYISAFEIGLYATFLLALLSFFYVIFFGSVMLLVFYFLSSFIGYFQLDRQAIKRRRKLPVTLFITSFSWLLIVVLINYMSAKEFAVI